MARCLGKRLVLWCLGVVAGVVLISAILQNFKAITDWTARHFFRPSPPIAAVVQAVKLDAGLVVLSAGRAQGVQEGAKFSVYRANRLVATVQVLKVYEDVAGARILFTKKNDSVQVGDKAETRL